MYRGFRLKLSAGRFKEKRYLDEGAKVFGTRRSQIRKSLSHFKNPSGALDADKIMEGWFPALFPPVFVSHSHQDQQDVISLAGWLKLELGLDSFVDSCAWGYAGELIQIIDKEYSKGSDKNYDYNKRNASTAHVHLMLTNSLARLIHNSECVIFVDTPNSIPLPADGSLLAKTVSPWIYTELTMTQLLQTRTTKAHRDERAANKRVLGGTLTLESQQVNYTANTGHLTDLSSADLLTWHAAYKMRRQTPDSALDALYASKPNGII